MDGLDRQDLEMALVGYEARLAALQAEMERVNAMLSGRASRPAKAHRTGDGRKSSWTRERRKRFSQIRKKYWAAKKRASK